MLCTLFYSWQSDLPNFTNRGFIQQALEDAAKAVRQDESVKIEPVVDRDTQSVPGSPDIGQTIFAKIDNAVAFVCDVSLINSKFESADGIPPRPTPNPNVLIELGYAAKSLGWERIILVFNTDYGSVESLPFDLRPKRTLTYSTSGDAKKADNRRVLQRKLEGAIRDILNHTEMQPNATLGPDATLLISSSSQQDADLAEKIHTSICSISGRPSIEERIKAEQNNILGIKPQPPRPKTGHTGIDLIMASPINLNSSFLLQSGGLLGFMDEPWRESIVKYCEDEFKPYLLERDAYLEKMCRTIPLPLVLTNGGTAPVEGVQLIVKIPPSVVVYIQPHIRPEAPKRPEKTSLLSSNSWAHRIDLLQKSQKNLKLSNLLSNDPLKPEINAHYIKWQPGDLQHHLPLHLAPLYLLVAPSLDKEKEVRISYEVHGKNLVTPKRGELLIFISHEIEQWHIVESREEKQFLVRQNP